MQALIQSGAVISIGKGSLLLGYGSCQWKSENELEKDKPAFYFPDFFLHVSRPWLQFSDWMDASLEELRTILKDDDTEEFSSLKWQSPHEELFKQEFRQLQIQFRASELKKAVPYAFAYSLETMQSKRLRKVLLKALDYIEDFPGSVYGFWAKDEGLLGITPEVLFNYDFSNHPILNTMALAGTKPKHYCSNAFKNDFKEQREHQLVVDGIKTSLAPFGQVMVGETRVLELPTLKHLKTPIKVELKDRITFEDLVKVLHPTPALGAFPKEEGWQWLNHYQQKLNRGRYGAPAGLWHPLKSQAHCLVAIRNVQWNANEMRIGAGCGVIQESKCEQEWKEIQLKMCAIQSMLAL